MNSFLGLPVWFFATYIFLIGLCCGSFLNVVILRGLSGEEFVKSRSKCPKCNNQLTWYMNIPLFSYIFLKGKCAFCKEKISIQYPIVELVCGLLFLCSYFIFGLTLKTLFLCFIFFFFIALCVTDYLEQVIIDYHAYILAIIGFIGSFLNVFDINWVQSLIGALVGFFFFEILARIGCLTVKHRFFGEGDSLITLALGAIFGAKALLVIIPLSFLIQTFFAIPMLSIKAFKENKKQLAFGYFIVLLSIIACFCVNYFNLFKNDNHYLVFVVLISLLLFYSLKNILAELRLKAEQNEQNPDENNFNLMPFGPALVYAGFLVIFWFDEIKLAIKFCLY
ncbi:MAG: prepilin peptidase [Candidatus Gastranaerophilales bacterium]|nr:prepilin peptidase [Candidatus Gastranaerophilales bacterium]